MTADARYLRGSRDELLVIIEVLSSLNVMFTKTAVKSAMTYFRGRQNDIIKLNKQKLTDVDIFICIQMLKGY